MVAIISDEAPRSWLVTGCSSGIGRELALELIRRGEKVAVTARNPAAVADLVALAPKNTVALRLDVTCPDEIAAAVAAATAAFGVIDVLVNNAGSGHIGRLEELSLEAVRGQFETNFFGAVALIKAVLPGMRRRRAGQIVNISSVAGLIGFPRLGAYCATKFALAGLTESLAGEVAGVGVKVSIIELGPFATNFSKALAVTPSAIADYDLAPPPYVVGNEHWGAGENPAAAAAAIVDAMSAEVPPLHLVLGKHGVEVAQLYRNRREAERERWAELSLLANRVTR